MRRLKVAHHPSLEAQLLLEDPGQQVRVLAAVGAVDLVIRAHDRAHLTFLYRHCERQCVDFLQRALVELSVDYVPVVLLRVHVVVLGSSNDMMTLDPLDVASGYLPGQHGILSESLEQATEDGDPGDVQLWTKQDVVPCGPRLQAQQVTILLSGGKIPSGRQCYGSRQRRRLFFIDVPLFSIDADTGRSVSDRQHRYAEIPARQARAELLAEHIDLLFQGHLRE